ncbi:protocadherin Fat 4-like [Acropora muricata]|uniref:protocadherin Fat 4-like n=1 Tax=Acropora muricata TaxID=159855 RepID=UPI0034E52CFA
MGYKFEVDEGQAGLTVGVVKATDLDEGTNAAVVYSLKSVQDYKRFAIDASSGEIKTAVALDRESTDQHNIQVICRDKGSPSRENVVQVLINVSDINDHRPVFSQHHYFVAVKEQQQAQVILNLMVTDRDIGINAAFFYSILSGNSGNMFHIDSFNGALSTTAPLDREKEDSYILLVRVSDSLGNQSYGIVFYDSAVIEVIVEDSNDNSPVFNLSLYSVQIYENVTTGSAILQLSAQDQDVKTSLQYSIVSGNSLERFFIDAYSGVLYVKNPIDRDPPKNENAFLLTVMANDGDHSSLNSTTKVRIVVFDVNDSPPEFESAVYTVNIPEDAPRGSTILAPVSSDRDASTNKELRFSITKGNNMVPPQFFVDSSTGIITSYESFDYDQTPNKYTLTLTATDAGQPPLSGNTTVIVQLQNVNDNDPIFTQRKYFFVIMEGSLTGGSKEVGRVTATDNDQDEHSSAYGQLKYEFLNQSGFYRDHQWPLDDEDNGKVRDIRGGVDGTLNNGAHIVFDEYLGKVMSLNASQAWLLMGDFKGNCVSNPTLCPHGLTVAFWLKYISGQYILSSGGKSSFATGFDFYHEKADGTFRLILETSTHRWSLKLKGVPKIWFYASFTWQKSVGLRYFQNGRFLASTEIAENITRASDIFTTMAIGKPNNMDIGILDYYSKVLISDLLIWRKGLTDDEVFHSYKISRHVTGRDMPTSPQYEGKFAISDDGIITAIGDLDREVTANYTFDVLASDLDPFHPRHNTTVVEIEVADSNDNSPVFMNTSYEADLIEHSSVGARALKVQALDSDKGSNSLISYAIVSGNVQNAFTIDSHTGEIKVNMDIDREKTQQFVLGVQAKDGGDPALQSTVQVIINVVDVNDNPPIITPSSYVAEVKENLPPGQSVLRLAVEDADHGINGQVTFHVNSNKFAVNSSTGTLHTTQMLDREEQNKYQLIVQVTDGAYGVAAKRSSVSLEIRVKDENDNPPQFFKDVYKVAISENATIGSSVIRVLASDPDHGSNADLTFTIQGGDQVFSINSTSGLISVSSKVDRESNPEGYNLLVTAKDHGYPLPQFSTAFVNISVSDINDNAPRFDKFTYSAVVREDSVIGETVTVVHAVDEDEGLAGEIVYIITAGNEGGVFAVDAFGNITVAKKLDRETKAAYELTITAQDRGGEAKATSAEVDITVSDANDNPPFFRAMPHSVFISESALPNTPVYTLIADDPDVGINKAFTYAGNSPEGQFAVDAHTGVITTVGRLDFEKQQNYTFYVVAMDKGVPQKNSSTLHVNITLVDENDNNPKFEQAMYNVQIWENETIGGHVIWLTATEKDSAQGSVIGYNISAGDPQGQFKIFYLTGEIVVYKSLDRELVPNYTLRVTATDNGNPPRYGDTLVTISLRDVNDRTPVFQFRDYQSEISEDSRVGTTITTLLATDMDAAENTALQYSIISGDPFRKININTVKMDEKFLGVVTVAKKLDRENKDTYTLHILVSDGLHNSTVSLEIQLTDVNDGSPSFNSTIEYSARVAENSPSGLFVLRVSAVDPDLGLNAKISYSLEGGDDKFIIVSSTGEIRTAQSPLDREEKSVYHLIAVAKDRGNKQGRKDVTVHVTDLNDEAPLFNPLEVNVTLTEGNFTTGIHVVTVNATDKDEGDNKRISYSIINGNLGNVFQINNSAGVITTRIDLDREATGLPVDADGKGVYSLIVEARDHGSPVQRTTSKVRVFVCDINDNAPQFPLGGYSVNISEGAKANSDVIAAVALDPDAGSNSQLIYELISGNTGGDFTLDPNTAMIRTRKNLERQQTFSYTLTVGVSDQGKPSRVGMTQVYIEVGDINDNDPVFDPVNYTVFVYENSPVGTPLVNVTATDADSGQNARITYSVTGGDPYSVFTVDTQEHYGTVRIKRNVDREQKNTYNLEITAADGGVPLSKKALANVYVTVLDQNDNRPQFSQAVYSGSIMENSRPGITVDMNDEIEATDPDLGLFGSIEFHLNGSESHEFSVEPTTGVIITRKYPHPALDHERTKNYSFYVVAVDENGIGHASVSLVKIQVIDTNDNVPRFEPPTKSIRISEDSPVGFSVTKVFARDPDSDINGKVSYSMLSGTGGNFEIGRNNGVIRVAGVLDRETRERYVLNVSALDGSYFPLEGYGTVFVTLTDINDNVPTFESLVYKVKIAENSPVGAHLVNVSANDPDYGVNSDISYFMRHPKFQIDPKTGSITTTGELDREIQDTYSFIVRVQDGGGLESTVAVNVVISDANDNSPYFLSTSYKTNVMEKTPIGAIVLNIVAQDQDSHQNAHITYSISDAKDNLFTIEPSTGFIKVHKTINRIDLLQRGIINANGSYIFKVIAQDHGFPRLSSEISVEINIVEAGDDSPVFNRSSYEVNVTENKPPGTPVLRVAVSQQRPGAQITFTIVPSQAEFLINASTGDISTLKTLDREARDYYVFTVEATDNGQIPLGGYTSVTVYVSDQNDNAPWFQFFSPDKMTVMEDAPLGTAVGQVQMIDRDLGKNAEFEYAIRQANIGPGQSVISVHTECGTPLGLENGDVKASDIRATSTYMVPNEDYSSTLGRLNNKVSTQFGISYKGAWCAGVNNKQQYLQIDFQGMRKVTEVASQGRPDSNDYVSSYMISFRLDGNLFEFHRLVFTGNRDSDRIHTNRILPPFHARYVRVHPQNWNERICLRLEFYGCESTGKDEVTLPFVIDPDTGYINVSSRLDREQQAKYILNVEGKDKGTPPMASNITLEVIVVDTNDNPPVFTEEVYHATVPENAFGGFQVTRLTAMDADEGSNAAIAYSILQSADYGKFIVEESSGIVRPSSRLDYESLVDKFYILNISASDDGHPQFTTFTTLNISVTDFNDNQPEFAQKSYKVDVFENETVGTYFSNAITATDADTGDNGKIAFSLKDDTVTFSISPETGQLKLLRELDRETTAQYQLTVTATDGGAHRLLSKVEVFIQVLDINDNSPKFTHGLYARMVSENVALGTTVEVVQANDADTGRNGQVSYKIGNGNAAGLFSINEETGAIVVEKALDRETNETIRMHVLAEDAGDPKRFDQSEMIFILTDVNDNAPVIWPRKSVASVFENVRIGSFVHDVNATDNDVRYNGELMYAIMHGHEGKFSINTSSGIIATAEALDRETKDSYTLIVMARDKGTVPYMDFGTVEVNIRDRNDNEPFFKTNYGPFKLKENQVPYVTVGKVYAEDQDVGKNAEITYSVIGGDSDNQFDVNSTTGEIFTRKPLDREKIEVYNLVISAINGASSPKLSGNTTVRIDVLDTNDEAPLFTKASYNETISEGDKAGTPVVIVSANDKDLGTNGRVLYKILYDDVNINVFSINQDSGEMILKNNIEDEEYRSLIVLVEAKDLGSPQPLASVVPVYVTVADVNDNQPIFDETHYSAVTSEGTPVGHSVIKVRATDEDKGTNAEITYAITSGDDRGDFSADITGTIYVNRSLDRERTSVYSLTVAAYNYRSKGFNETSHRRHRNFDANGYLYDTSLVTIAVTDLNDNAPEFIRSLFTGGVAEGADLNTFIMKIRAIDRDTGNFSSIQYRISSGNDGGFFMMNEDTGFITTASNFKGKKGERFEIQIGARDNHGRVPTNEAREDAIAQIFVLLDNQRVTLRAEVDPSLIERNKEEFISVLNNITEAEVNIEAIFKVFDEDSNGRQITNSEVLFHAVNVKSQTIMTSEEALRTIEKYADQLNTLYARWKIQAPYPSTTEPPTVDSDLGSAELALVILGCVVGILLLLGLCFAIKTRCRVKKREMHTSPRGRRKFGDINRQGSWSYYDDVMETIEGKTGAPVSLQSQPSSSYGSDPGMYSSDYVLTKKDNSLEDRIWDERDYYLSQDSKQGSYLDDDGESELEAAASDISHESSAHCSKTVAEGNEEMIVTKV